MVRRLWLVIALALIIAACSGASSDTSGTVESNGSNPPNVTETTGAAVVEDGTTTTTGSPPEPTWTELPGLEDLPQEVRDQLLELVRETEELRGLVFVEPPIISVVSDAELERRVRALIEEDSADFPADDALYTLLGLLDEGLVLESLLTDLYGEQVAGFYDGETGELVVPMRDDGFTVAQRATMIHELTHSLTDQHFSFDPVVEQLFDEERFDQVSSFQALIEGDATLTELFYLQGLSQRELGELFAEAAQIDTSTLDASPQFIQDSLLFPYDSGLAFVQAIYNDGGWSAVNEVYTAMPLLPGSTEQVFTPSDYGRDLPLVVVTDAVDIPGYELEAKSVWGELGFRIMLDQVLGEADGLRAADGWGGDTYYQWFNGSEAAFLLVYEGDTEADLEEMKDALVEFAVESVADEDFVWVEIFGSQLAFIAADDEAVGGLIRDSFQD